MDYLRLGELTLAAGGGVRDFSETIGYHYAQHDIIEGKPVLQSAGAKLSEITLNIVLFAWLGHDIEGTLATIDKMCLSGEPQKLVFANGVFKGDYAILSRDIAVTKTDSKGNILSASFSLSLLEYADRVLLNTKSCERKPQNEPSNRKITAK